MSRNALDSRMVADLIVHIGMIPGCTVLDYEVMRRGETMDEDLKTRMKTMFDETLPADAARSADPDVHILEMHVRGRSPSLHELNMRWSVALDGHLASAHQFAMAVSQIEDSMVLQRTRAEASLALGHPLPLPILSNMDTQVGHLHADASMLALLLLDYLQGNMTVNTHLTYIRGAIVELHKRIKASASGTRLSDKDTLLREIDGIRLVETTLDFRKRFDIGWNGPDGLTIPCEQEMPEQVLIALGGRRLSDLRLIHPFLDGRTIASAEKRGDAVVVKLEPLAIRIGDYAPLRCSEALARLDYLLRRNDLLGV